VDPQWLRVDRAIGLTREELAESTGIHIPRRSRRQGILTGVAAVTGQVVVVSEDARQVRYTESGSGRLGGVRLAGCCNGVGANSQGAEARCGCILT
jgi:hypothetical protein